MLRVLKHRLSFAGPVEIRLLSVLRVAMQHDVPTIWVTDGPDAAVGLVSIYGTGQSVPCSARHVGSFADREFIWHAFAEVRN